MEGRARGEEAFIDTPSPTLPRDFVAGEGEEPRRHQDALLAAFRARAGLRERPRLRNDAVLPSGCAMKPITQLNESELEEIFARASGPGGQNVNKVSTRVTLRHLPTNISVTVQDSRSQYMNRQIARERLLAALQNRERQAAAAATHAREKLRRQNAKRPRGVKERMLESKRHRSSIKKDRRRFND